MSRGRAGGMAFRSTRRAWVRLSDNLMRHKYRQCRIAQDVAGSATEDELPQSTLRVGTLDQEVTAQCVRVRQNRLAGEAAIETDG